MVVLRSLPIGPAAALAVAVAMMITIHSLLSSAASNLPMDAGITDNAALGLHPEPTGFAMNSWTNRCVLAATCYISYNALLRDVVPCSRRSMSYYGCQSSAEDNPTPADVARSLIVEAEIQRSALTLFPLR
ncbi:hypothetical protein MLD38_016342 [Melastoma candidum]|uniref:Uncharacterized protein n=1 Tax=Melastoma candidum TaxID=119954 RepID=A0ACB9RJ61_9MYRT|nr:hypothetical protein MLD38_016342 [Melastoma candidum]